LKTKIILAVLLTVSLLGNGVLSIYTLFQNEQISLVSRLKTELVIISDILPDNMKRETIEERLRSKNHSIEDGAEYTYAEKPNSTFSIGSTYFIFSPKDDLIQINSLSSALEPIYKKP
jgi:hypothetical protein